MFLIIGKSAYMRQTWQDYLFDKSVSFFVDHINNRVMFFRMTIGTYKYILIGHCKSLRSHGSTHSLFVPSTFRNVLVYLSPGII